MAKKAQTPPPPRRPQAPKTRTSERKPGGSDRRKWIILAIAAALGIAALGVAAAVYALGSESAATQIREAGCELETFPSQEAAHVEELEEGFEYNSTPPTSGPHHPIPAPWGIYDEPVDQLRLVHNLEHGGVAVQYGPDVPQEDVDALTDWYRDDPTGLVVAPFEDLGDRIALGAWNQEELRPGQTEVPGEGVLATCPRFDEGVFDTFVEEYGFRGPERFSPEDLRPHQS